MQTCTLIVPRNIIPKDVSLDDCLEKQIPQPPDIWGDGVGDDGELIYDSWDCPRCNTTYETDYDKYNYCPNCGQRIDRKRLES